MAIVRCEKCEVDIDLDTTDAEEYKDGYLCIPCVMLLFNEDE